MKTNKFVLFDGSTLVVHYEGESELPSSSVPVDSSVSDTSVLDTSVDSSVAVDDSSLLDSSIEELQVSSVSESRDIMTTPLDEFTITESLLLIAVIFLGMVGVFALFRGR